jgi:predicted SAM-dependent methyltransferase
LLSFWSLDGYYIVTVASLRFPQAQRKLVPSQYGRYMTADAPRRQEPDKAPVARESEGRLKRAAYRAGRTLLASRTMDLVWFDVLRLRARARHVGRVETSPPGDRLHLGCGKRRVPGWLNVDVTGSDFDIDFTRKFPWVSSSFSAVVSQHVVEHLELFEELIPFLCEVRRVLRPSGEVWLSCPDMETICRMYADGRSAKLVADRVNRGARYSTQGAPPQQIVNDLFHQWGEHKNLLDFDMAVWVLRRTGFINIRRVREADLLERFPGFPVRGDDVMTLYVAAQVLLGWRSDSHIYSQFIGTCADGCAW